MLIRNYFDANGNGAIERISFADAPERAACLISDPTKVGRASDADAVIADAMWLKAVLGGAGNVLLVVLCGMGDDCPFQSLIFAANDNDVQLQSFAGALR